MEIIAVALTLICVWLASNRDPLSWGVGIVAAACYAVVFFDAKLYADFGLQFIFIGQGILGWYIWSKNKFDYFSDGIKVKQIKLDNIIIAISVGIIGTLIVGKLLSNYTNAALPYIDAGLAINSLIANWLLAKRYVASWIWWFVIDIGYIGMFIYKELEPSAILYGILALLTIKGFIEFNTQLKRQ